MASSAVATCFGRNPGPERTVTGDEMAFMALPSAALRDPRNTGTRAKVPACAASSTRGLVPPFLPGAGNLGRKRLLERGGLAPLPFLQARRSACHVLSDEQVPVQCEARQAGP